MFNTQYQKTIPLGPALAALLLAAAVGIAVAAGQVLAPGTSAIPGVNDGAVGVPVVEAPSTWTQDAAQRRAGSTQQAVQGVGATSPVSRWESSIYERNASGSDEGQLVAPAGNAGGNGLRGGMTPQ